MSHLLSSSQLGQLRLLFARADSTGAGSLSASQLAALLRVALTDSPSSVGATSSSSVAASSSGSGVSEVTVRDLLTTCDVGEASSEGRADFDEFVAIFCRQFDAPAAEQVDAGADHSAAAQLLTRQELEELKSVFASLDLDSDQLLSPTDLQKAFARLGDEYSLAEVEQMVREVDTGKGGKISLASFLAAMSPA